MRRHPFISNLRRTGFAGSVATRRGMCFVRAHRTPARPSRWNRPENEPGPHALSPGQGDDWSHSSRCRRSAVPHARQTDAHAIGTPSPEVLSPSHVPLQSSPALQDLNAELITGQNIREVSVL